MAYSIGRERAAKMLGMSTRTIDRYIRKGKIRSKKNGKVVMLHEDDVKVLANQGIQQEYEIIGDAKKEAPSSSNKTSISTGSDDIMDILTRKMREKDAMIQELSYKLGKIESELKNSIPMLEYRKTALMLETSKSQRIQDVQKLSEKATILEKKLANERFISTLLIIAVIILLMVAVFIWYTFQIDTSIGS